MVFRAAVAAAALLVAAVAGQSGALHTQATSSTDSIASCPSLDANGIREGCTPSSPDTDPATVLGHEVLTGGCPNGDLHVLRYFLGTASAPLVATWCD